MNRLTRSSSRHCWGTVLLLRQSKIQQCQLKSTKMSLLTLFIMSFLISLSQGRFSICIPSRGRNYKQWLVLVPDEYSFTRHLLVVYRPSFDDKLLFLYFVIALKTILFRYINSILRDKVLELLLRPDSNFNINWVAELSSATNVEQANQKNKISPVLPLLLVGFVNLILMWVGFL